MRLAVLCVVALFSIVGLVACGDEGSTTTVTVEEDAQGTEPVEAANESSSDGRPEIQHEIASCDLGGNLTELIGSVRAENDGDAAASATVSFKWQLGDGSYVTASPEQVELEPGQEELVFFSEQVKLAEASSFQDHPGYIDGSNCEARVDGGGAVGDAESETENTDSGSAAGADSAGIQHEIASCDLGGNLTELIGSVRAENDGDAAASATVSFKWQLGDGSYVTASPEQVELEPGQEELVFFSEQVKLAEASSFQDHPGYIDGSNCEAEVTAL